MEQPFDQQFYLQQIGKSTFFSPKQGNKGLNPIVHQWQTSLSKLHQKYDRSLIFSQLVYWLEDKKIPLLPRFLAFWWWFFTNLEIYPQGKIGTRDNIIVVPIVDVPRDAKPKIYQHLQELAIPCWRSRDGNVWVEISNVNIAILVHRTIKQSTAKSQEMINLLKNCWDKDLNS